MHERGGGVYIPKSVRCCCFHGTGLLNTSQHKRSSEPSLLHWLMKPPLAVGLAWLPKPLQRTAEKGLAPKEGLCSLLPQLSHCVPTKASYPPPGHPTSGMSICSSETQQRGNRSAVNTVPTLVPNADPFYVLLVQQFRDSVLSPVDEEPGVTAAIWTFDCQILLLTHCGDLLCLHNIRCGRS